MRHMRMCDVPYATPSRPHLPAHTSPPPRVCLPRRRCDGDLAILFESWYKSRRSVWWRFAPDRPEQPKEVVFDR